MRHTFTNIYCMLSIISINKKNARLTRRFNVMTHFAGPAYWVQKWTPHVAPEVKGGVFRGFALVCIHQPQTAADDLVYGGHTGATHVFGVHHLHIHTYSERGLHAFCQLGRGRRERWQRDEILVGFIFIHVSFKIDVIKSLFQTGSRFTFR